MGRGPFEATTKPTTINNKQENCTHSLVFLSLLYSSCLVFFCFLYLSRLTSVPFDQSQGQRLVLGDVTPVTRTYTRIVVVVVAVLLFLFPLYPTRTCTRTYFVGCWLAVVVKDYLVLLFFPDTSNAHSHSSPSH